jgi:predicted negative regulator of RcsB-dependent stress response
MDSNHRHELEENDLFTFLKNFKEWWNRYGTWLLAVTFVVVASLVGYRWYRNRVERQLEETWSGVNGLNATTPDAYLQLARDSSDPSFQARACLAAADLYTAKAVMPVAPGPGEATERAKQQESLKSAESAYQQVLAVPNAHPLFKLNARLGLAAVAEGQKDWGAARKWYKEIAAEPAAQTYAPILARAKARLAMIDRLEVPVPFAPTPERTLPPTSMPSVLEMGVPPLLRPLPPAPPATRPATP